MTLNDNKLFCKNVKQLTNQVKFTNFLHDSCKNGMYGMLRANCIGTEIFTATKEVYEI